MKPNPTRFASTAILVLTLASASAATVTFSTFNPVSTGNDANVGGSKTGLTVTRSGTGTALDNFIYSFSYTNGSYDGDMTLDTLTFDVRVQGFTGGAISTGTTTAVDTAYTGATATIGTDMDSGKCEYGWWKDTEIHFGEF